MNDRWEEYKKVKGVEKIVNNRDERERVEREERGEQEEQEVELKIPLVPDLAKLPPIATYHTSFGKREEVDERKSDPPYEEDDFFRSYDSPDISDYRYRPSNYSVSFLDRDRRQEDLYPTSRYGKKRYYSSYKAGASRKSRYR